MNHHKALIMSVLFQRLCQLKQACKLLHFHQQGCLAVYIIVYMPTNTGVGVG